MSEWLIHPLLQTARGYLTDEDYVAVEATLQEAVERAKDTEAEVERLRLAIRAAMDTMATSNDMQLGPGGIARKAYAGLYVAYFTTPQMVARASREQGDTK